MLLVLDVFILGCGLVCLGCVGISCFWVFRAVWHGLVVGLGCVCLVLQLVCCFVGLENEMGEFRVVSCISVLFF